MLYVNVSISKIKCKNIKKTCKCIQLEDDFCSPTIIKKKYWKNVYNITIKFVAIKGK
jgi:hypothetical protein